MTKYKLIKLGYYWHIMERKEMGWWDVFSRPIWITVFPYYWYKEEAEREFERLNKL